MLLFINILDVYEYLGAAFQYISCYSLSKGRWNLNLRMMRFNTSHVTLYLTAATGQKITVVFQYISCYSLSAKNWAMDHLECEFQYISCYSLSYQNSETELVKFCFNTSHVTLYPKRDRSYLFRSSCFNTSHVTLYRGIWCWFCCRGSVSIHLMLLFIELQGIQIIQTKRFQYISCYSLSKAGNRKAPG